MNLKKLKILKNKICLICCRGGSKKIKNKNIKKFAGKPLLNWIIEEALKSKVFDKIILSTDSKKIWRAAQKYNILIPGLRPKKLAGDRSNQFDTHKYIFKKLNINNQNSIVCVLNNNPFIKSELIKKSYRIFKKFNYKRIVADYCEVDGDYIAYKQFHIKNNRFKFINKKKFLNLKLNRQELKIFFTYIFNIRWGYPSDLTNYKIFKKNLLNNGYGIKISKLENFDIDNREDWQIALSVFNSINNDRKK
jgi:CMP-N-acetylneuraminic acid synthetase